MQYSTVQCSTVRYSTVLDEVVLPGEVVLRQQHCQGSGQGLVVVVSHCCVNVSVACCQCCIHNFEDILMNGSHLLSNIIKGVKIITYLIPYNFPCSITNHRHSQTIAQPHLQFQNHYTYINFVSITIFEGSRFMP